MTNLQTQMQGWNKEIGKKFGYIVGIITLFLIGGQYIPEPVIVQFYIIGTILVNGIVVAWLFKWIVRKFDKIEKKKDKEVAELKEEKDEEVTQLRYDFEQVKKTMGGRISILEQINPYAVWEMDLATGLLIHVNSNFQLITGYSKEEVNDIITKTPEDFRPTAFVQMFVQEEHWQVVEQLIRDRLSGEQVKRKHHFNYRRKNGESYPAKIAIHMVNNNGYTVLHGVIEDRTREVTLEGQIAGHEAQLGYVVTEFTKRMTERELNEKFIKMLEEIKEEIHIELKHSG